MDAFYIWISVNAGLLLIACSASMFRQVLIESACSSEKSLLTEQALADENGKFELAEQRLPELHPAELAYLLRPGDGTHCLIVLFVDFLQKALKDRSLLDKECRESEYERAVFAAVKQYLTDWSKDRVKEMLPSLKELHPAKYFGLAFKLRSWLAKGIGSIVSNTVKDPLSLRQYFQPGAILRVLVSMTAASGREKLNLKLQSSLIERGLLMSETERRKLAAMLNMAALAQLILLVVASICIAFVSSWQALFALLAFAAFDGLLAGLLFLLPSFLPFYPEINKTISIVSRQGFRISVLRSLFASVQILYLFICALIFFFLIPIQAGVLSFFPQFNLAPWTDSYFAVGLTGLNVFVLARTLYRAHDAGASEQLTAAGMKQRDALLAEVSKQRLINNFSRTLSSQSYQQDLSYTVAAYGIESLLLIA